MCCILKSGPTIALPSFWSIKLHSCAMPLSGVCSSPGGRANYDIATSICNGMRRGEAKASKSGPKLSHVMQMQQAARLSNWIMLSVCTGLRMGHLLHSKIESHRVCMQCEAFLRSCADASALFPPFFPPFSPRFALPCPPPSLFSLVFATSLRPLSPRSKPPTSAAVACSARHRLTKCYAPAMK